MNGKRRTESPESQRDDAANRQRAFDLFAAWLERHEEPRELDEGKFTELLSEHPELRDELVTIRAGLDRFRGIAPSRLRAALDAGPRLALRRWWVRVAAAAAVVALAGLVWRLGWPPPARSVAPRGPLAVAVIERGVAWLDDALKKGGAIDALRLNAFVSSGSSAVGTAENPLVERLTTDAVRGSAGIYSLVHALTDATSPTGNSPGVPQLAKVRESLRTAGKNGWRSSLLKSIDAPQGDLGPAKPFLFSLRQDPAIHAILATVNAADADSETTALLIAQLTAKAVLRVRAIDLDADGMEVVGATVYAQPIELPGNEVGAPINLGVTPLPPSQLDCGDWRITVVDAAGARSRLSEVRLLAAPGEDLGVRVLFLRDTDDVIEGMAFRAAATFRFGSPDGPKQGVMDLPETTARLGDFWIDPCEVTCAQYSDFYLEVTHHPEWFEGVVPVHRPEVLAEDGSCPTALQRRPIVGVTWSEAVLYANWAGKRLPTEREWERVARGTETENRTFPWGDTFSTKCVNDSASSVGNILGGKTTLYEGVEVYLLEYPPYDLLVDGEVDSERYVDGATPKSSGDRVFRMADNASEYVEDLYVEGMATSSPSLHYYKTLMRVEKGSNWMLVSEPQCMIWTRMATVPDFALRVEGIRCVKTAEPTVTNK